MNEGVFINKDVELQLHNLALGKYPSECCAILLGKQDKNRISYMIPVDNSSELSKRNVEFEISPFDVYKAEDEAKKKDMEIYGVFHSHPDHTATLSEKDEENMIPGMIYIIVSTNGSGISETRGYLKENPDKPAYEINIGRD